MLAKTEKEAAYHSRWNSPMSTENELHPSIKFVMSLREDAERCELGAVTGSAPSAAHRYREEIAKRRVVVEDEWQTAEDWLDAGNFAEASYFLERMISETRKLKLTIEAAVSQEPNGVLNEPGSDKSPRQ